MKPISNEKRELLIAAKQRGEKEAEIALWLCISKSSVGTLWRRYKNNGDFSPTPYKGRMSRINDAQIEEIRNTISESPDITLDELIDELSLPIKKSQLSKLLIKLGFSFKKRLFIQKNNSVKMSSKSVQNGVKFKKS